MSRDNRFFCFFSQEFAVYLPEMIIFAVKFHTYSIMRKKTIILLMMLGAVVTGVAQEASLKPRLVVCTDIAPADVEPDDMESMVRLMAYADQFEIEALITSVGWNCDPYPTEWAEYLQRVITAYGKDVRTGRHR